MPIQVHSLGRSRSGAWARITEATAAGPEVDAVMVVGMMDGEQMGEVEGRVLRGGDRMRRRSITVVDLYNGVCKLIQPIFQELSHRGI